MAENKKSSISKRSSCYLLNLKTPDKTGRRLKLSFQRTNASVNILKAERLVEASVGFLDVSEVGAGVFTPELLHKGSLVMLRITEPSVILVRGIVAWSIPVTSGIHKGKFKFRSGIQFVFDGEGQQIAVQEFVRKVSIDQIENIKNATAAAALAAAAMAPAIPSVDPTNPTTTAAPSAAPTDVVVTATSADAPPSPAADAPAAAAAPEAAPMSSEAAMASAPAAEAAAPASEAPPAETPVAEAPVSADSGEQKAA